MTKKLLSLLLLLLLLVGTVPELSARAESPAEGGLVISELMASNKASVLLDGGFPDWAEIHNTSDTELSLEGIRLCCKKKSLLLPAESLAPGAFLLVSCEQMRLSREGAVLRLEDADGVELDRVSYENAPEDQSLIRTPEGLAVCRWPSPGEENSPEGYARWQSGFRGGELLINEAAVYNDTLRSADGEYYDWIELKNNSGRVLSLSDYRLADKPSEIGSWRLPDVVLEPGALYILACGNPDIGVPFALSSISDELFLTRADGLLCDWVSLHDIPLGGSMGRMEGEGGFFYFPKQSPGAENPDGLRRVSEKPRASEPCGIFEGVGEVAVSLSAPGEIHYTLDGSLPTSDSPLYTEPVVFTGTGVLRAVCMEADALPSKPLDLSYFLNEGHTLPVVSVITEPDLLFSADEGIYSNPEADWEVPASAALFAEERGFEPLACGLKIHGAKSRTNQAKKSFKLCFRNRYDGLLDCDLFENGITEYNDVLLRAAWESSISTQMRDVLMHVLGKECSASLPTQDYRYCVLYLNGEYWGLYALREAHSVEHYARHFGYDPESVTMSQGGWAAGEEAKELYDYLMNCDISDDAAYDRVRQRLDVESVIAWSIVQSYSGNIDMNSPNMRFYRSDEDGLLRYALVDLDLGFFGFGDADLSFHTGNDYSAALSRLMDNDSFRALYLRRLSEYLHGPLSDESFLALVDRLSDETRGEVPRDYLRWGKDPRDWQHEIDTYLIDSTHYPGGHVGMLARSARGVFDISDEEWETLFADLDAI